MSEWKEYKLGDLTKLVTKGTTPSSLGGRFVESGINYIKSEAVGYDGRLDRTTFVCIDEAMHQKLKRSQLAEDDILFSMAGIFLGKNALVPADVLPANTNQALAIIRLDKSKATPKFIHYYLRQRNVIDFVNNMSGQSAQPNINFEEIKSIDILLPGIKEQIQITSILSSLDDKIDLLHRQNKTLEQLADTLFRQWFVEEAKESWEVVRICDVAKINAKTISKNYPFKEIEYLDTGSITEGRITDFQTYALSDAPSRAQRIVEDNDIVYSLVRPIQRHYGLLHGIKKNTVASTGFCVITSTDFCQYFLYILLTRTENVEYLDMIAEGATSTYPSLKPSDIANFEFSKPPKEKLNKFSKIATESWAKINANQNQILILTQLRDTLLPKLMSGEVRVNTKMN